MADFVKIIVGVPESHADALREAIDKAGAGKFGNYSFCSFTTKGVGRFLAHEGANPAVGTVGRLEEVIEERIEVTCERNLAEKVVQAIKKVHPYEVPVIDIYPLLATAHDIKEL